MALGGSSKLLKALNEAAALGHLLDHGELTRAELRALTGLSKPTVSEAIRRLADAGLVVGVGHETGRPGPNAEVYAVEPDAAYAVAISVRDHAPALTGAKPLDFATVDATASAASEISYEIEPTTGQTQKRFIGQLRTLYRKDDLTAFLPVGTVESLALPGESYKLALTPGLLNIFQPNATPADLTATLTGAEAEYCNLDGDGRLWVPSGQIFYSPTPGDSAPSELAIAQAHFFLPRRYQDPFGANTVATYDGYDLLLVSTLDAVGKRLAK